MTIENRDRARETDAMAGLNESLNIINRRQLEKKRRKQERDQHNEALRGMLRRNEQVERQNRW